MSTSPTTASSTANSWELSKLPHRARPKVTAGAARVVRQQPIGDRYVGLTLYTPAIASRAQPGQFVMLTVARAGEKTPVLPRPMAIYSLDVDHGTIEVLYGVVGGGTRGLQTFREAEEMFIVGPLGRGFEVPEETTEVLLVGRGIGTCSLTTVAQQNEVRGIGTIAVTSAREPAAIIGADFYRKHGACSVYEVTDRDGTSATEGLFSRLTRDWDASPPQIILTCGSDRLARLCGVLAERWGAAVQVSVEAHMACGLGYCHGCASGARSEGDESPLICSDGPVFAWVPSGATVASGRVTNK